MALSLPSALILALQAHIVLSRDSVVVAPSHIDAARPLEQARFQCILGDKPSPYNSTTWTYRGHLLPCNQGDRKFACGDTLIISNVAGNDSGPYECHVNQSGSTLSAYGEITVPPALDSYELEIVKQALSVFPVPSRATPTHHQMCCGQSRGGSSHRNRF